MTTDTSTPVTIAGNDRIIQVLDALVRRGSQGWGVRELSTALDASRTTVHRALLGLADSELAAADPAGNYSIGPRARVHAALLHRRHPLLVHAPSILETLSRTADATALVGVLGPDDDQAFVAAIREREGPMRYQFHAGAPLPLHAGAVGRAILSVTGVGVLPEELPQYTERTVTDHAVLRREIEEITVRGFALSEGQHIPLATGIAVPVRMPDGLVAAVSASRPRSEVQEAMIPDLVECVRAAARDLHEAVAASSPHPAAGVEPHPARSAVERLEKLVELLVRSPTRIPSGAALGRVLRVSSITSSRLQSSAEVAGLVLPRPDGGLTSGPLLLRWAATLGARFDVAVLAHEHLVALASTTGETVGMALYDAHTESATMAAVIEGRKRIGYTIAEGSEVPLHAGAAGKAILAFCDAAVVERVSLAPLTANTTTDVRRLRADLADITRAGSAVAGGERIPEALGIAAPIFADGVVRGSVTITIPRARADSGSVEQLLDEVRRTARRVSTLISVGPELPVG
ncbi:hypothetical protein GCM10009836_60680 [Pseudonocardia ailaonensis]|uniref:IclR family transcriptional regulator n=1 Tax=Pseudonocardia ailaonensis TaxID=367279 RepID=A0ABN2NJV2_9PSEU